MNIFDYEELKTLGCLLVCFMLGILISHDHIYEPYFAMAAGEQGVRYSQKGQFIAPLLVAGPFAAFLVLLPDGWKSLYLSFNVRLYLAIALLIASLAGGAYLTFVWFPEAAEAFGYPGRHRL